MLENTPQGYKNKPQTTVSLGYGWLEGSEIFEGWIV